MLGMRLLSGLGVPNNVKNLDGAAEAFDRACVLNHPTACFKLARVLMDKSKHSSDKRQRRNARMYAANFFTKSCSLGHMAACANAGAFYYYGVGVKKDKRAAELLCEKACNGGTESACALLKKIQAEQAAAIGEEEKGGDGARS